MEVKRRMPNKQEQTQKHANLYIGKLMDNTNEVPDLDFPQIAHSVRRFEAEEVGSDTYSLGDVKTKFLALAEGFVPRQLRKLLDGTATKDDSIAIEAAIQSVEMGEVQYPASIGFLKNKLLDLQRS